MELEPEAPDTTALDDIGLKLEKWKDEAVAWKSNYETRIAEARRQYQDGTTRLNQDSKSGNNRTVEPEYKRAVDNITKTKVRKGSARIGDMIFPTNDNNYSIEPSPVPTPSPLAPMQEGIDPNTAGPAISDAADESAEEMETQIKDYLDELNYAAVGRMVIDDGCLVGTGVLHGPFPKKIIETASKVDPVTGFTEFVTQEKIVPWAEHVPLDDFFPQPAKTMDECGHVFRLYMMTKQQVFDLIGEGFDNDQVRKLLAMEPDAGSLAMRPAQGAGVRATLAGRYPVWKYTGTVPVDCLAYFGIDVGTDELTFREGTVWFSQGITLKAAMSDIKGLPYYVWNYEKDPESLFGWGIPHACMNDQYDANLMWAAAKLNGFQSAFPQVGILKSAYKTESGTAEYPSMKPFLLEGEDINRVIQFSTIPSTIADVMMLYNQAKSNADEHTMMPMIDGGVSDNVNLQAGAAVMAMTQAGNNIIQRYSAKSWDDQITVKFIKQMIDFELLYGQNPKCKGTFDVIPKASSHLLVKDMKVQQLMQLLAMADSPANSTLFKRREIIEDIVHAMDSPAKKYLNTKDEEAALQQQAAEQPNPEMMKLEVQERIETMKAQNDLEIAKLKAQSDQLVAQMSLEAASIKAASDEVMTAAEQDSRKRIAELTLQSKAFNESMKDQREREKDAAKLALEAEKLASKEAGDMLEVEVEDTPRLA